MNTETLSTGSRGWSALLALCLVGAALGGCRQNMHNQHKIEPLEASDFFADGQGARQLPAGVVSRDIYGEKVEPSTGLTVSGPAPVGPPPVTMALLQRGQERFNIFCTPCHDRTGSGRGMIVRRGYKQPPSYHEQRLRNAPVDYFVTVMTEGFGVMPSYREEVPLKDRWAIAYYIRALQYSQRGHLADLPAGLDPERRQAIEKDLQR